MNGEEITRTPSWRG